MRILCQRLCKILQELILFTYLSYVSWFVFNEPTEIITEKKKKKRIEILLYCKLVVK